MNTQTLLARRGQTALALSRVLLVAIAAIGIFYPWTTAFAQSSTPVDVGWRDFSFGSSGTSDPTGEKPESKLWWNDGLWWGCLYNDSAQAYHIYRLSLATQSWTDTGTLIDDRNDTNCDTLWDQASLKLYVVSHIYAQNAGAAAPVGQRGQLYRYSYNAVTKIYTLDSGFPIEITGGKSETLVVAKDSLGTLWVTYTESQKTMVNHSLNGNDLTWGTPFSLPVTDANNLDADDVCSIIAYNGKVGVLWSNQNTSHMYFGVHIDGDSDQLWQSAIIYSASADDHMNVKAAQISASGGVVAAIKTSQNAALMILLTCTSGICATASDWHSYPLYDSTFGPTRPSLLVDTDNRELYFFTRNKNPLTDAIYYKKTSMDNIQFTLNDIGTPFILSSADPSLNNPTSTKQNLNATTGLVAAAGASSHYFHNYQALLSGNKPTITSFNPASGPVGTQVTLTGSKFTGSTSVTFNSTSATFFVDSDTQLRATVPAAATSGKITVTNAAGSGSSATDFTVIRLPSITSFSPTGGDVGTQVTVTGTGFTGTTAVSFNNTPASTFTVDSDTQLRATVSGGTTTGKISVTNAAGTAISATNFTVGSVPLITSFSPASGVVGAVVTITGSHFTGATAVTFNSTAAITFTINTDTQITATVPTGATTGKISVNAPGGIGSSATDFVVIVVPTISSFSPTSGSIGAEVTILGTGFAGTTSVKFNGTSATVFTVDSNTQIRANVPSGATTGKIRVTNPAGNVLSATNFTVLPTITSFTPTSGVVGTVVTISGTGFTGATAVSFNGTAATTFTVNSNSQIHATVPTGATTGKIGVTKSIGTGFSTTDFTVIVAPAITSFTPSSGIVGTQVVLTGTGFAGTTAVKFNGTSATTFTVDSNTQITATVPTGATTGKINVTNPAGTADSATDFTVIVTPAITSFLPTGAQVGAEITITGTGLFGATGVKFNGVSATTFTVDSNTQVRANVPVGASTGKISVTNPAGTGTSAANFTLFIPPTVTSFSPTNGLPGTSVIITGTRFTGATAVNFNGIPASFVVNTATQITATAPAGFTTGKITVTTFEGTGTSANDFILIVAPTITSFSPAGGLVASQVVLTGTGFTGTTAVKFNGTSATTFTVNSNTQITATVPTGATTGKINVTNPAGTADSATDFTVIVTPAITSFLPTGAQVGAEITITGTGLFGATGVKFNGVSATTFTVDSNTQVRANVPVGASTGKISVTNPAGTGTSATNFTLFIPPTVTSFSPTSGIPGTSVTITGTRFTGATSVTFNGTSATFVVNTATQITATVPADVTSGKISVTTFEGTGTSVTDFTLIVAPTITTFTPASGVVSIQVTLTGTGLFSTTAVAFNGTSASFTVDSNTQIRATVPSGATSGPINVTNTAGSTLSATDFTVTIPQTITFTASADAQVKSDSPANNYGTLDTIRIREENASSFTVYRSYVRFTVSGVGGTVTAAKLRLFVTDANKNDTNVFSVAGPWLESTITWTSQPGAGVLRATGGPSVLGTWYEITLPASLFTSGNGTYDFLFINTSSDSGIFTSREGSNPPQLVLTQSP